MILTGILSLLLNTVSAVDQLKIKIIKVKENKIHATHLLDRYLHIGSLIVELAADVNVRSAGTHSATSYKAAFYEGVGVMAHDLTIFAGTGFTFIGVDHEVFGPAIVGLIHEPPLHAGRKASTTATTQAGDFHFVQNPIMSLEEDLFCFVPVTLQKK